MRVLLSAIIATLALTGFGLAQTIGPGGGPIAPGPSQPQGYTPGGSGPGGVSVAPGPAARGVNIDRTTPGGALAPGPAGSVSTAPLLRTPTVVRTRQVTIVRKAKRRAVQVKKRKRRPPVAR